MGADMGTGPVETLRRHLDGQPELGSIGLISARAGLGKSALLVHVALHTLLQGGRVLHVALKETVEHVRAWYDEIFRVVSSTAAVDDRSSAVVSAERNRMVYSYAERAFDVSHLEQSVRMLAEVAQFRPDLLVIDGLPEGDAAVLDGLAALSANLSIPVWGAMRVADVGVPHPKVAFELRLVPEDRAVRVALVRDGTATELPLRLDAVTMMVLRDLDQGGPAAPLASPALCTLYSGGANGAEQVFGEAAERWGLREVNFTFEGHKQDRERGRYLLSPRELAAGDVSLAYVSRRLNRTYQEGTLIRKVLQTLWHMVSRSQTVFVLGEIQPDGTVTGGTGWSVELARMWSKPVWVFDQTKGEWFRWDGRAWVPGLPFIESLHFTGTGTRYVDESGRSAIHDLFERSFGPAPESRAG